MFAMPFSHFRPKRLTEKHPTSCVKANLTSCVKRACLRVMIITDNNRPDTLCEALTLHPFGFDQLTTFSCNPNAKAFRWTRNYCRIASNDVQIHDYQVHTGTGRRQHRQHGLVKVSHVATTEPGVGFTCYNQPSFRGKPSSMQSVNNASLLFARLCGNTYCDGLLL